MYEYRCIVLAVVDGDTLHLDIDLGCDHHTLMTVRLDGIDAPEMKTGEGKVAKVKVVTWITEGKALILHTVKDRKEKYGRYLGTLYRQGDPQSLNDWLLVNGYAKPYGGGAR